MRTDRIRITRWARWVGTFIGFPLAGVAARLVVGDVDAAGAAAIGGVVGGAVLGIAQATIGGIERSQWSRWVGATAAGLGIGLCLGASAVGFETDAASLVVMGAISGAVVGVAQALSVPMRAIDRASWAVATPALWALGWLITSQVIVDADARHAIFGSSGALVVSVLAGVLHAVRQRSPHVSVDVVGTSIGSAVAR
jgi:hypothetical protein